MGLSTGGCLKLINTGRPSLLLTTLPMAGSSELHRGEEIVLGKEASEHVSALDYGCEFRP